MKMLSEDAAKIFVLPLRKLADCVKWKVAKIGNHTSSVKRVADVLCPRWRELPCHIGDYDSRRLVELDAALKFLRRERPELKTHESRARAAARAIGVPLVDGWGHALLLPAWRRLLDQLSDYQREQLVRLGYWASGRGIAPERLNVCNVDDFAAEHLNKRKGPAAERFVGRVKKAWREAVTLAGIDVAVPSPSDHKGYRYARPHEFTDELRQQIEAESALLAKRREPWLTARASSPTEIANELARAVSAYCLATGIHPREIMSTRALTTTDGASVLAGFLVERGKKRGAEDPERSSYRVIRLLCQLAEDVHHVDSQTRDCLRDLRLAHAPPFELELPLAAQECLSACSDPRVAARLRLAPEVELRKPRPNPLSIADLRELSAAIALEFALGFGILPYQLLTARFSAEGAVAIDGGVQLVCLADGSLRLDIPACHQAVARSFMLAPRTQRAVERYLKAITTFGSLGTGDRLLAWPPPGQARPINDAVRGLVKKATNVAVRVDQLRALAMLLVLSSGGTREHARSLTGRKFREPDPLFLTVEGWVSRNRDVRAILGDK
jgi:hypothetical protein